MWFKSLWNWLRERVQKCLEMPSEKAALKCLKGDPGQSSEMVPVIERSWRLSQEVSSGKKDCNGGQTPDSMGYTLA